MRIIIAGGRDFKGGDMDVERLDRLLSSLLERGEEVEVVSGGARGADKFGESYATIRNLPCKIFKADWDTHGNKAGVLRNYEMAKYADALVAFWDNSSRGTKHMIETMQKLNKPVRVLLS